ncbi:hypothetical protein [Haloarcula nitratireducens]|uniref:Uncharacterized protein n=1 Tax=Haloarcula nitratireducens TaxID=2487749 RepID=A0AAW4P8U8_9EURY|nr:hypothetical protein [Halomicroarcula nitratireducens]MBX0294344.1 hypothetical protein [Halomicroarcula nitratireducens]
MSLSALFYAGFLARLALFAVAWLSIGYWFYADSAARGSSFPALWGVGSVLFWPSAVYYLVSVRRSRERARPVARRERVAWMFAVSSLGAAVAGTTVTPPDPLSGTAFTLFLFVALFPLTYGYLQR